MAARVARICGRVNILVLRLGLLPWLALSLIATAAEGRAGYASSKQAAGAPAAVSCAATSAPAPPAQALLGPRQVPHRVLAVADRLNSALDQGRAGAPASQRCSPREAFHYLRTAPHTPSVGRAAVGARLARRCGRGPECSADVLPAAAAPAAAPDLRAFTTSIRRPLRRISACSNTTSAPWATCSA